MKTIAFFNNKGGVGKTTLACNFGAYLSSIGMKVTVIDLDPQANSTQLLLDDAQWERLYEDLNRSNDETVMRAFTNFRRGDSTVVTELHRERSERFNLDVVAGHPSLSIIEDTLSSSWSEFRGGQIGGARRTTWLSTLTKSFDSDVFLLDLGPSLGALNRSALIGADGLITPVAADLFSLYALANIGSWITNWSSSFSEAIKTTQEENSDPALTSDVQHSLPILNGYVGYTVQQYVAKNVRGEIRATGAYDRYVREIPVRAEVLHNWRSPSAVNLDLGRVPHMFSIVPLAQRAHSPISDLKGSEGVRGAQLYQLQRYQEQLKEIFHRMAENAGLLEVPQ